MSAPLFYGRGLLQDKVVVVTGASQGIGKGIVLAAANHGAHIVLHHLGEPTRKDAEEVKSAIEGLGTNRKCILVGGDISQEDTSKRIVSDALTAFSRIDILISNAGICPFHEFLTMPTDLWRKVQDVNLNGAFFITREVANVMAKQFEKDGSRGSIVCISSISAFMGGAGQTHYTPTKAALKSMMESCAIALAPIGIRCNSILPGTIETPINQEDLADQTKRVDMLKRIPLARFGTPEDIAEPACFVASDLASYITGASLLVDGGAKISLQ